MKQWGIIAELADTYGAFRSDYSGRGMFGAQCVGIVTSEPMTVIKEAAARGIRGAKTDDMGLQTIIYWPHIQTQP
jgi:hypothetical protein